MVGLFSFNSLKETYSLSQLQFIVLTHLQRKHEEDAVQDKTVGNRFAP